MPGFELFGDLERKQVNEVLKTGVLAEYNFEQARNNVWKARELQDDISKKLGVAYTRVTSSGTTALITAMNALGLGANDEIIMPSFTFVASFEAVMITGAIPVLVDIDDTLTLSPAAVRAAITPRTKAIMPVHMCGAMAQMDEIMAIAKEFNLLVLEDACQAIGGSYHGKYLGTIGDMGCYSFDYVKTVTCGEGGAVFTNNKAWFERSDQFIDHGHDHVGMDRGAESHPYLGLNFRISELNAAVGVAQWSRLDEFLTIQRKNHGLVKNELKTIEGLKFRRVPDEKGDNCSHLSIFLPTEEIARKVSQEIKQAGLAGAFFWYDNNWHYVKKWEHLKGLKLMSPIYKEHQDLIPKYENIDFSKSDEIMNKTISLAISLKWTDDEAMQYGKKIKQIIEKNL